MGAKVDHTRDTFFIHVYDEPEQGKDGATVGKYPMDWPEIDDSSITGNEVEL